SQASDEDEDEDDEEVSSPPQNPLDLKAQERAERFRALRARAKTSATANLQAVHAERRRQTQDPHTLLKLQRLRSTAEFNLAKSDAQLSGSDFDRKRAWDWTVEESALWDKKLAKKSKHVADVAFQDYTQSARKIYKKQIRELGPTNKSSYEKEKMDKIVKEGQVYEELVDEETGETRLVAVDRDGNFYADKDSLGFIKNKPKKEGVDRLVGDLRKQEERRAKNKKGRGDEDDVTYINDKNKQFNMKLARYYNKYTGEIRDSFERGTMI
ncbi:SYF2 splicing factor-domain-containing protein, partial [Peziza echinospora]